MQIDRVVTYNYLDSTTKQPIWTTGSLDLEQRGKILSVFDTDHMQLTIDYSDNDSSDVVGNTDGSTIYYSQETGTDQINAGGVVTAIHSKL